MIYRGWTIEINEFMWYEAYHQEAENYLFANTLSGLKTEIDEHEERVQEKER